MIVQKVVPKTNEKRKGRDVGQRKKTMLPRKKTGEEMEHLSLPTTHKLITILSLCLCRTVNHW
jgi:hypothetical protein